MDNNDEEFWEEYKQKLILTKDKWNYIDALIYRYRKPENVPIKIWLDKLDDNPNYWQEYLEKYFIYDKNIDKTQLEYKDLSSTSNKIELNDDEKFQFLSGYWKYILLNLQRTDKPIWLHLLDSKITKVSKTTIYISISTYSTKTIKDELSLDLEEFESKINPVLIKIFEEKKIKNSSNEKYKFKILTEKKFDGFYWEELVANPQIPFAIKSDRDESTWEHLKKGLDQSTAYLNLELERFQNRLEGFKKEKIESSEIDSQRWFIMPYEIIEKLLNDEADQIKNLSSEVLKKTNQVKQTCRWVKRRKILETKFCFKKPLSFDQFCEEHIALNDELSQSERKLFIEIDLKHNPKLDVKFINYRHGYPTPEVVAIRKKINELGLIYYIDYYTNLIVRQKVRIERWKLLSVFYDALKPVYEKYHYLKFGRPTISMSQKLRVMKKTDFKCAICKADLTEKEPHIDHIIPLIKGGGNAESNLQALCWQCNLKKGTKIL
jgi:hypothetical protein